MAEREPWWTPGRAEQVIGTLLRTGVLVAGVVVVAAGGLYLVQDEAPPLDLEADAALAKQEDGVHQH